MLSEEKIENIEQKALKIRQNVIEMLFKAGSGHLAGSLGMADIFAAFYFHILNHDPENPLWDDRDRLILSNGHIAPARYAAMALSGYFDLSKAKELRQLGSVMQGHPERSRLPALETTSGPLGLGLGQAAGIAKGAKMDGKDKDFRVYCLLSDGEQDEGNTWESAMFVASENLNNLTAIIDRNNIQISGYTHNVMPIEPLKAKYEAFGWYVLEADGHSVREIIEKIQEAKSIKEKPTVIIAHTTAGKGVKEIENDYHWHGKIPQTHEEMENFLEQVDSSK